MTKGYLIIGWIMAIQTGFLFFVGIMAKDFPYYALTPLSLTVMSFCMHYLYPQFKEKDERMKMIREKGIFYSYFAILGFFIIIMSTLGIGLIDLTAMNLMYVITSLTIMTVFISMVIMAKIY
ncbi:permease [Rossellomorea sp. KS-H15a]|uniref:permease n=1 Tax=Rossellomorea sp. KS-H15a TaxID=2963940 RepID=UPI0020C6D79F|nr:permease [Rossellomorea sp. KS-H15a]UTE78774.1 permease [Rossellomorea sp. KS-H15a]